MENETYSDDADIAQSKQLQLAANLNIAACNLKLNDNQHAIEACEKVLKIDAKNEKALFRTAQAHVNQSNFSEALKYFNLTLEANEHNKEAHVQLAATRQKMKEYNEKEKKLYTKMFSAISKPSVTKTEDGMICDGDSCRLP